MKETEIESPNRITSLPSLYEEHHTEAFETVHVGMKDVTELGSFLELFPEMFKIGTETADEHTVTVRAEKNPISTS